MKLYCLYEIKNMLILGSSLKRLGDLRKKQKDNVRKIL